MSAPAAPLTPSDLAAALDAIGGFEARPCIAVALSGGPDSLALTILAERWARERGGRLIAVTVDHQLRPESASEARLVSDWLRPRGIRHEVLVWDAAKPKTGIQEAAREARYRLLAEWCRAMGCLHLMTAHHRDDQIDDLIRKRAGSGVDGLAGMSAVREMAGLRLLRPLLTIPKARLVALLAAEGQPFACDPSNLNPSFERGRLRLDNLRGNKRSLARLAAEVRRHGRQRLERERRVDRLLAGAVSLHPAGFAVIEQAALSGADVAVTERLFGRVARCIGGALYPPRGERVRRLCAGLRDRPEHARTLGGCRFVPWRRKLLVLRELAAAAPPLAAPAAGSELVWDRRFRLRLPQGAMSGIVFGYLGQSESGAKPHLAEPVPSGLPRLIQAVLPGLWDEDGLIAAPHLGYARAGTGVLPRIEWRPAHPLSHAGFTVV